MKKKLILLPIFALALSLTACGNTKTTNTDTTTIAETTVSKETTENITSTEETSTAEAPTEETTTLPEGYTASEEIINASKYDQMIQIGNTVLHIPFTFQDILDAGATIKSSAYTPDYLMAAGDSISLEFVFGDGDIIFNFENDTDSMCPIKDLTALGYNVKISSSDIFLPGGIHIGSSMSDLQEAWGAADIEESEGSALTFSYYEYPCESTSNYATLKTLTGNFYAINLDRNTANVTDITMKFNPRLDTIVEHTFEYVGDFDFILPFTSDADYGLVPTFTSVKNIDGMDYVITFPSSPYINGGYDFSATEEALNSILTNKYIGIKETIDQRSFILKNDENLGIICAFYTSADTGDYCCKGFVLDRQLEKCSSFTMSIYAYNGEATSDNAKAYFIDLMKELIGGSYFKIK